MKKTLICLIVYFLTCVYAYAQVSINAKNFPDEVFRTYISKNFDLDPKDDALSPDELAKAQTIRITNTDGLRNVKGIELMTGLKEIYLHDNRLLQGRLDISTLSLLAICKADHTLLTQFIVNIQKESFYTQLTDIQISDSKFEGTLDISTMPALVSINASNNLFKSFFCKNASYHPQLRHLLLANNSLKDISPLLALANTELTDIHINDNRLGYDDRPLIDSIAHKMGGKALHPWSFPSNEKWNPLFFSKQKYKIDLLDDIATNAYTKSPVLLAFTTEFTAENMVELRWKTIKQADIAHIEVMRSDNEIDEVSIHFETYNSKEQDYKFIDRFSLLGTGYYRLKIFDKQKNFHYSQWLNADTNEGSKNFIRLYPDPINTGTNLMTLTLNRPMTFTMVIVDSKGITKLLQKYTLTSQVQFSVAGFEGGYYDIRIMTDEQMFEKKFMVCCK